MDDGILAPPGKRRILPADNALGSSGDVLFPHSIAHRACRFPMCGLRTPVALFRRIALPVRPYRAEYRRNPLAKTKDP